MINKELISVLNNVKNTNSRLEKEELLKNGLTAHSDLIEILRIVYNSNLKLGVNQKTFYNIVTNPEENKYEDAGEMIALRFNKNAVTLKKEISIETLKEIIKDVQTHSGNDLKQCLINILGILNSDLKKLVTRIILKNLRIGLQLKTINKIFKDLKIPIIKTFEVQLCGTTTVDEWEEFPCIVEEKYDGFRCVISKEGDIITMTSRQGKDVSEFLPEIYDEVKKIDGDFVLDGEVMAKTFKDIQRRIGRKGSNLEPVEDLHYRVFDILKWNHLDLKNYENIKRLDYLDKFRSKCEYSGYIKYSLYHKINDVNKIGELYDMIIRGKGEGLIIKKISGTYDYGSRKNWFKLKPVLDATLKVVGIEKGKGKYKDTTGALWCEDLNGLVKCKVGSGLNDETREYFKNIVGDYFVDVKYSEITKNKDGNYSLRHPRFDKIRFDKTQADELQKKY